MFIRSGPAALKAVQGFGAKAAPQIAKPILDTVTNPQTYRSLAAQAENVLQRGLPGQFAGPNFGNIPARFTGLISDVAGMPAGLQRSAQAGIVNRALQEAAGAAPQLARSVQQYATGALKAPVIGDAVQAARQVATGVQGALVSPTGFGGPFMRDPGLRREFLQQFGGTSEKAARALAGGRGINFGGVGNLVQDLGTAAAPYLKPSSAFSRVPVLSAMPGWAQSALVPTSAAGSIVALTQLEGSSPQSEDPFGRWQQLGYASKDDMLQRVSRQAQIENSGRGLGKEKLGPESPYMVDDVAYSPITRKPINSPLNTLTSSQRGGGAPPPPPAPVLPAPTGSQPGAQAGQLTSIVSNVPANGSFVGGPTFRGTGLSTGAGVPALRQNVQERALSQEVLNSAQQYAAPASLPLPSFYEGQQQLGRRMEQTGELQRQLTELSGATGMPPEALMEWANKNPGLAYRELKRLQGRNQ
jgi:hypothetical protein